MAIFSSYVGLPEGIECKAKRHEVCWSHRISPQMSIATPDADKSETWNIVELL